MTFVAAVIALMLACPVSASDEPDELLPGRVTIVKLGKLAKFVARPASRDLSFDLPDPSNDPRAEGATLRIFDSGGMAGDVTFILPAGAPGKFGWKRLPANEDRPLKGYRYRGTGKAADPCKVVLVREKVVKAVCRGAAVTLQPPFAGDVDIVLSIGTDTKRYCASFGGTTVKNNPNVTKRKLAPDPASCPPSGAACSCGASVPQGLTFATGVGAGSCGAVTGGPGGDIVCGGLYFGGGLDSVPLPITIPDFAQPTRFRVDACNGNTLTIGGTTDAEAGGTNKECTTPGCLFGPPLPVPNALSTPTSTCLYNSVATEAAGTLACDTGEGTVNLPIFTDVFLTGDLLPNRCQGGSNPGGRCTVMNQATDCPDGGTCQPDPDVQPCPICNPTTNVCNGGMNNGSPCVPGSTQLVTGLFPTSQDCRISDVVKLGTLDIRLGLTTGTSSDTAVPSGTQQRVFCGFCRDADGTGAFAGPPAIACESNAECTQPFESCEQQNQGAFANGEATLLTATGSPGGSLADFAPHASTLVSVFCIPPVYSPIIDSQADLPGPGALTLQGTAQLSAMLSPSGAFVDEIAGAIL